MPVFSTLTRQRLKVAKTYCLPQAIRFKTGSIYLVGEESTVKVEVDSDLFGAIEIPGELYFEGECVNTIVDLIVSGSSFEFVSGQAISVSDNSRSTFVSVSGPSMFVPMIMESEETDELVYSATISEQIQQFATGIEFAFAAIRGSKAGMFSNRIFFSESKDRLLLFATDNRVINISHYKCKWKFKKPGSVDTVVPAKTLYKAAKLIKQEQSRVVIDCYRDCALINCVGSGLVVYIPLLMGTVPDYSEVTNKVKACDVFVTIEDVAKMLPPKEILKVGDFAKIEISNQSGVSIIILQAGANSRFYTGLTVSETIRDTDFKVNKDEFFRCLSMMSGSIYIKWTDYSPVFIALVCGNMMSVHALELGG